MTSHSPPAGSFRLKPGLRLIPTPEGGVLLQPEPLRALKINAAALDILERCRTGFQPQRHARDPGCKNILPFLDAFVQGGLLTWEPPEEFEPPMVSVIIPVYNRPHEIQECLSSLLALDYPSDKVEVIVVDDASRDHTAAVVRQFDARLIVLPHNLGQSAARNAGVGAARGEIIAFLDSDCIASPQWLRDLVPFFQDPRVALVGGYVDAYYHKKRMDRYEQACSALNMGPEPVMGKGDRCVFYVPTCNMLVRKVIYVKAGGLDETLRVGEDVDLCWRLMADGHHLLYEPRGAVRHKHRNHLWSGLLRRFDYGTSEAVLYDRFPKIRKQFPWQPAGMAMIMAAAAALVTQSWPWLVLLAAVPVVEAVCKRIRLQHSLGIRLPMADIFGAAIGSHLQLTYHLAFYVVRYHLLALMILSCFLPALIWLWSAVAFSTALVAYLQKRPRLSFPVFAFFYLAEHIFYQSGAFRGCLRRKSFRLYGICFRYAGFLRGSKRSARTSAGALKRSPQEVVSGSS